MSFHCPVCNGMQSLNSTCSHCESEVQDCGRLGDFFGPYSPYRPIDDIKMTNGIVDLQLHQCTHIVYCAKCNHTFQVHVDECII